MRTRQRSIPRTCVRRTHYFYLTLLLALIVSVTLLTSLAVWAADGDLDPTFDGDGIVTASINHFSNGNDLAIQPDGKIVVVGSTVGGLFIDFAVTRYQPDGSLDGTFGSGGIVTTSFGVDSVGQAVGIQSDGKIVVTGTDGVVCCKKIRVVRYNADGSLDSSFGSGGIVSTVVQAVASAEDLVIQSDGKIVVVGNSMNSSVFSPFLIVVRYNSDGSLDNTFDGDGVFLFQQSSRALSVALQGDGKIVAAGNTGFGGEFLIERLNTDGSLDSGFGTGGIVTTQIGIGASSVQDVAIQPDGKIVAVGWTDKGIVDGALARYNTDGSLDTSFDSDGIVNPLTPGAAFERIDGVALQTDGKIVVAGTVNTGTARAFEVKRYNANGSPDATFGSGGTVITPVGKSSGASAVAIQADGKIVAAGSGNVSNDPNTGDVLQDFLVIRYGAPDAVNNPPVVTITGPASGSIYAVGTPVSFTGNFTDDAGDTHTAEWHFESITQPARVVEGTANTTYTFNEPGIYYVSLTVTDDGNLSGTATTVNNLPAYVVIYDPKGGWVTGGGWINSPAGAFAPMPSLTGKATFGFVLKYQNGASVPTGNTEFQFEAGGLNFKSTSSEWLVISGGKRAQYKGTGTINGGGNYRFMITCIDGDKPDGGGMDKFRIRIWSDTNGLVYDNQFNAPDSDDPTTALGGGSIVIHR